MSEGYEKKYRLLDGVIACALQEQFEFDEDAGAMGAVTAAVIGPYEEGKWKDWQEVSAPEYIFRDGFTLGVWSTIEILAALMSENPLVASADLNNRINHMRKVTMEAFDDYFNKKPKARKSTRKRAA